MCFIIPYVSFIPLHSGDEGNSRNETWHWKNDAIGVAVQNGPECELNSWPDSSVGYSGIQWSWVQIQISLRPILYRYFKESFSGEYRIQVHFEFLNIYSNYFFSHNPQNRPKLIFLR